ncbi:hypothetical protein ACWD3J_17040 [Streptomyces sp. NPDC002755]
MRFRAPARLAAAAMLALSVTAGLTVTTAPAAHAVGEHSKCTVNWSNYRAIVAKNGWNYRTGPGTSRFPDPVATFHQRWPPRGQ